MNRIGSLDVQDVPDRTVGEGDGGKVRHRTRIVHPRVDHAPLPVHCAAGDGTQRAPGQVVHRRERVLADRFQILLLERVLPRHPLAPGLRQGFSEDLVEPAGEVALAPVRPFGPLHHLLGGPAPPQVGQESRAVQVGVHLALEVDLDPLRDQAQRILEAGAVPHHRAEHHLVPGALGPADPAGHPGLQEHRQALVVPAGSGFPGNRQVEPEDRLRDSPKPGSPCPGRDGARSGRRAPPGPPPRCAPARGS